jgi:hypothetical protein
MEEADLMGFSGGFKQGKLVSALLELKRLIATIKLQVKQNRKQRIARIF